MAYDICVKRLSGFPSGSTKSAMGCCSAPWRGFLFFSVSNWYLDRFLLCPNTFWTWITFSLRSGGASASREKTLFWMSCGWLNTGLVCSTYTTGWRCIGAGVSNQTPFPPNKPEIGNGLNLLPSNMLLARLLYGSERYHVSKFTLRLEHFLLHTFHHFYLSLVLRKERSREWWH